MKQTKIILLIVLVAVGAYFIYSRALPALRGRQEIAARQIPAATPSPLPPLRLDATLPDGSFNFVPPSKQSMHETPTALVTADDWRGRYGKFLERIRPEGEAPTIAIYQALDQTEHGVGICFREGWRLAAAAALVQRTNARIVSRDSLEPVQVRQVDMTPVPPDTDRAAWRQRASEDPAAEKAQHIVLAYYEAGPTTGSCKLSVELLSKATGETATLLESEISRGFEFGMLARQQRQALKTIPEALVSARICQPLKKVPPDGLEIDSELRQVALLLDSNDTWGTMEGIDRALWLARLFPEDSRPLQAASYGLNVLGWYVGRYQFYTSAAKEYGLRSFALSQIATNMDERPGLTVANALFACMFLGHAIDKRLAQEPEILKRIEAQPEFRLYLHAALGRHDAHANDDDIAKLPDWLLLRLEGRHTWFAGMGPLRKYMLERAENWRARDLFLVAKIRSLFFHRYSEPDQVFENKMNGAGVASAGQLALEMAMLSATLPAEGRKALAGSLYLEELPVGKAIVGDAPEEAADTWPARARRYYDVRAQAFPVTDIGPPDNPRHPSFTLLKKMYDVARQSLARQPRFFVAESGWDGFEFTPAERVRLAQRNDNWGTRLVVEFRDEQRGDHDHALAVDQAYLAARPDNFDERDHYRSLVSSPTLTKDQLARFTEAVHACRKWPELDSEGCYWMGLLAFRNHRMEEGRAWFRQAERIDPFFPFQYDNIAETYAAYGYRRAAVAAYDRYLADLPMRFDVAIKRGWVLMELGEPPIQDIENLIIKARNELPGNSSFHDNLIRYYAEWKKDYPAALEAVAVAKQHDADKSWWVEWEASIAKELGDQPRAVQVLASYESHARSRIGRSTAHSRVAQRLVDLEALPEARSQLTKAQANDSWTGPAIMAAAYLAFAEKDYGTAMDRFQQYEDRYGPNDETLRGKARCLREVGKVEMAIAMLEKDMATRHEHAPWENLAPMLIRNYIMVEDKEKATATLDRLLASPGKSRANLTAALDEYEKLDKARADEVRGRLDALLEDPDL